MKFMYIVVSCELVICLFIYCCVVVLDSIDFIDVVVVVIFVVDSCSGIFIFFRCSGFNLLVYLLSEMVVDKLEGVQVVIVGKDQEWLELEVVVCDYEVCLLLLFFNILIQYVEMDNSIFVCLGYQYGVFFKKYFVGCQFYDFFGENVFCVDMCNVDVKLGDLLIYEGLVKYVQKFVVKVFNVDKIYFVFNGILVVNKVVINVLLICGDLVLFDCNNYKLNYYGVLIQVGVMFVYLEVVCNLFGFIGGIDECCFDEYYLWDFICEVVFEKVNVFCLFCLVVIQLGIYDGMVYNVCQVVDKIGYFCDYILFDLVWVGYEQFILMMVDCLLLLLELIFDDLGIFVIQFVYKQQVGFLQMLQIYKKDNYLCGQVCFCLYKWLNNVFMLYVFISLFYLLFVVLDVNVKIYEGESGCCLWVECVVLGIEVCKVIIVNCKMIQFFILLMVVGCLWQDYLIEVIVWECCFFSFEFDVCWYGFEGYVDDQYFVDLCKLLLIILGIDVESGEYSEFGILVIILVYYLCENGIVLEKCDFNLILFLLMLVESVEKMVQLVVMFGQFEQYIEVDMLLVDVLLIIYNKYLVCYCDYILCELCQEMYDLYVSFDVKSL